MSKALFNVGDKIRIVGYQNNIGSMERLVGRTAHIDYVDLSAREDELSWYDLRELPWCWREDWLCAAENYTSEAKCRLELAEPKTEREDIEALL